MSNETKKPERPSQRRPYERPAVVSDEVFETMALSCAKANRFTCPGGNPQSS
ncbi:MAG: hypothetical protein KBG48_03145 [Kofleriaceae bacterium]|jgi:hypothetical protein|nr:hypothetical protein [Kofleriaceae bacterium]MBP9166349.1 hypothetical protein [Kofleriaceae bacterium]MBP9860462.1 hypothetical protein [Kofleriaceae bacterium]